MMGTKHVAPIIEDIIDNQRLSRHGKFVTAAGQTASPAAKAPTALASSTERLATPGFCRSASTTLAISWPFYVFCSNGSCFGYR